MSSLLSINPSIILHKPLIFVNLQVLSQLCQKNQVCSWIVLGQKLTIPKCFVLLQNYASFVIHKSFYHSV
jgi:hypothetical protein